MKLPALRVPDPIASGPRRGRSNVTSAALASESGKSSVPRPFDANALARRADDVLIVGAEQPAGDAGHGGGNRAERNGHDAGTAPDTVSRGKTLSCRHDREYGESAERHVIPAGVIDGLTGEGDLGDHRGQHDER